MFLIVHYNEKYNKMNCRNEFLLYNTNLTVRIISVIIINSKCLLVQCE